MVLSRIVICTVLFISMVLNPAAALSATSNEAPHISLQLVADRANVAADGTFHLGVLFTIEDGWHIYWKNPGDSGLPTTVTWSSKSPFQFSPVKYPVPQRIPFGELMNFGYEKEALLVSSVRAPTSLSDGDVSEVLAKVEWILCKDECLPGESLLSLRLDGTNIESSLVSPWLFEKYASAHGAKKERTALSASVSPDGLVVRVPSDTISKLSGDKFVFVPETPNILKNFEPQILRAASDGAYELTVPTAAATAAIPSTLPGLLLAQNAAQSVALRVAVPVDVQISATGSVSESGSLRTVLFMLGSAFLGGLVLNLMPCVFPVLSLKLLEIARLGASRDAVRHSQVFAIGVISSFVALASLLIILKSVGLEIGWGFQFQSPLFVAAIAMLTFTIGLNLSGVFEIGLSLQNKAGSVQLSESYKGSFLSGVLATTLATPCTAPFMGSAIAFALAAPLYQAFLVFLMLGFGMSSPYLIIPLFPALTRFIPRPGAWMEKFKQALAFPMYATTTWLLWVLGMQADVSAVIACAGALVIISAGMWIFGNWGAIHCSARSRQFARFITAAMLASGVYIAFSHLPEGSEVKAEERKVATGRMEKVQWERYTDKRLSEVLAEKKPVLIDFTAAWCLVCQVNHARVLENSAVLDRLSQNGVVLLRADWTSRDSEISAALTRFGRSGVPLLVLMDGDGKSQQFESLVSQNDLISAIEGLKSGIV